MAKMYTRAGRHPERYFALMVLGMALASDTFILSMTMIRRAMLTYIGPEFAYGVAWALVLIKSFFLGLNQSGRIRGHLHLL